MTDAELRQSCHTVLPGHRQPTPAQTFAAMATWCEANKVAHDTYGEGVLLQDFEQKSPTCSVSKRGSSASAAP